LSLFFFCPSRSFSYRFLLFSSLVLRLYRY